MKLQTSNGYSAAGLRQLGEDRALNVLKTQVMDAAQAAPTRAQLQVCWQMLRSSQQQEPASLTVLGHEYHRHRNEFVFVPGIPLTRQIPMAWPFDDTPAELGGVSLVAESGLGGINSAISGLVWTLDKQGLACLKGQKARILERLRQAKVPHWVRQRLPLLVLNAEVIAIPAMPEWGLQQVVAEGFSVGNNCAGWHVTLARAE